MKKIIHILIYCLFFLAYVQAVPQTITFQGRLTESNVPITATRNMRFAIVDSSGTTTYWQSNASNSISISVNQGIYTINLGDTSIGNMAALTPDTLDIINQAYLRVWVAGTLLTPDIPLNSAPYAYLAAKAASANYAVTANNVQGIITVSRNNIGVGTANPATTLDISGTVNATNYLVSSMGGAPIIASGSNTNGSWIKYADGTMICWADSSVSQTQNMSGAGLYYNLAGPFTFPLAFATTPTVVCSLRNSATFPFLSYQQNVSATAFSQYVFNMSANGTCTVSYVAIGRWK